MIQTVIFGAGFLGFRLSSALPDTLISATDITDQDEVRRLLRMLKPTHVINAAGKTGRPNVDWCETHMLETYRANAVGPVLLAEVTSELGIHLTHLGSGCVFYGTCPRGTGGWREDDYANPSAVYSRSKYSAELVLQTLPGVCIARLRMPVDDRPHQRNLVTKLASYRKVIDVKNSLTVVEDMIMVLKALMRVRAEGIFHVVNPGTIRHARILELYRRHVDPSHKTTLIPENELVSRGLALKARSSVVLENTRLQTLAVQMRPVDEAVTEALKTYGKS